MTRIALLPSAYLPALGGVEELTRHLALELTAQGDQVEVWTGLASGSGLARVEEMDGLVVRRFALELPATNRQALARFPRAGVRALWELRHAVTEHRPDLLHVQCFGPNGAYALALARWCRLPLVVTLQGETMMDNDDIFEHSMVLRRTLRWALSSAVAVTGCSAFTLEDARRRFGLAPDAGEVVFNGVGADHAEPQDQVSTGVPPAFGSRYVFAVGRVVEKKGFDLLLEAFAVIAPVHPDVDLVIGGDGAALPQLVGLAERLGVSGRVQFPGRLSREQVARAMTDAEVFVMPSRLEPFGIVALEGWRSGTPVIATSRGGAPEFVRDGLDGLLVDPVDTSALARGLDRVLADPELANRLGSAGRARVEEFSWTAITARYREIYTKVLDPVGTRGRSRAHEPAS